MKTLTLIATLALAIAAFSSTARAAEEWGLPDEEVARFEAKVVDILCELTGDCPKACGDGKRQLGLLNDKGKLILPLKNTVIFAGVADELIEFCGKKVVADGLFTTNRGHTVFALQFVKEAPNGKWQRANRFLPKWAKKNGVAADSEIAEQWYEHDPRVKALIEKEGRLGLGLDVDKAYLSRK